MVSEAGVSHVLQAEAQPGGGGRGQGQGGDDRQPGDRHQGGAAPPPEQGRPRPVGRAEREAVQLHGGPVHPRAEGHFFGQADEAGVLRGVLAQDAGAVVLDVCLGFQP